MTTQELQAIRALSQYRPFEGGGESVREAHEDLVLAALAEAGGVCSNIAAITEAIQTLFGLSLPELSVAAAINSLVEASQVVPETDGYSLSATEAHRLDALAQESQAIAAEALAEWRKHLIDTWTLTADQLDALELDLALFLRTVIRRHGVEASLLLYPESEEVGRLYEAIEEQGFEFLADSSIPDVRDAALSHFIRHPTEAQRAYLAQNLNTAYFLTVLSIDPDGARLVAEIAKGQRVYVDTNFIYRLLGVQGPRYVHPAETILKSTQQASYELAITPWTLDEFRESLRRSRDFLEKYPIPPDEYATLAANSSSEENFVTAYWRQVRGGVKVRDFFEYYAEIETHVADRGVVVTSEGCKAVDAQTNQITEEMSVLAKVARGRYRHPATLEHDVKHRLLVQRLRGEGNRMFSNAGYWFLTHDSALPRYDYHAGGRQGLLPFCVTAGAWFQIVEAFRPKTGDIEQSLADMLASPYVRYRRVLSAKAALEVVGRVRQYKGGSPELAARVFMNSAAVEEIEVAEATEDRLQRIDDAIVAAAKEAQEEAREAREIAEQERRRADAAVREAQQRAEEAEREARIAIAAAEAARRAELSAAADRAESAVATEATRAEEILAAERARHEKEVADERRRAEKAVRRASQARRRLLFFFSTVAAIVIFLLLDLAVGLGTAWAILVASGVILSIGLGIAQWSRWHSD
jgi:hypothetical protein